MASSGIRDVAWNHLRWANIWPVERDGKLVAARMLVYTGTDNSYVTYITLEAYREVGS